MSTSCSECGAPTDEELDAPDGTRTPCPWCDHTARTFNVHSTDNIVLSVYQKTHVKRRRGSRGRPYREEINGDDLWRKTGQWMHLTRTIDRVTGLYSEKVVDPRTGEVVRQCEEPLSAHRGHGSAKKR
jgi:uncharacterized Zn finger protein (UPF0148 family)